MTEIHLSPVPSGATAASADVAAARGPDEAAERRAKARVPLEEPRDLFGRLVSWYARRTFGDDLDNAFALLHHRKVLRAVFAFESKVQKWDRLDPHLKDLAQLASAGTIGCSWCLDFGHYIAHAEGRDTSKFREVARWRDSQVFTPVERRVIEYAEAMTATPPTVTDELAEALRAELGNDGFVELTMMIAVENQRSRFNSALGLTSQGFSDRCELAP